MAAPRTALEEHLQQVRSFAGQVMPRAGNTRYASADDYLWIETKDCAPTIDTLHAHLLDQHDPAQSEQDAVTYARLALALDVPSDRLAIVAASERWPDNRQLARLAAAGCSHGCAKAMQTARRMAENDPDNVVAWLRLLDQAVLDNAPELFAYALQQAANAPNYMPWDLQEYRDAQRELPVLQVPAACTLEFERRSLMDQTTYDAAYWHDQKARGAALWHAATSSHIWSLWCLPDVEPSLSPADMRHCNTIMKRIDQGATAFDMKMLLVRQALWLSVGTPEHAYWLQRIREYSWLNKIYSDTYSEPMYDASGKVIGSRPMRDNWTWTGEDFTVVMRRWATGIGKWPPPSDYDPIGVWYGRQGAKRRLSQGPDRAEWPRVVANQRDGIETLRNRR